MKPFHWLLLLLFLQIITHVPYLNKPAMGLHVWRQCNTLSIARNYDEEDMRIWLPRIDKRYDFPGTTGPSFTAYEYCLAVLYKCFGFSEFTHRYFSLFISLFTLAFMFYLTREYSQNSTVAGFSTLALLCIPEFYYHSFNAVPDSLALAAMLGGWLSMKRWMTSGRAVLYVSGLLLIALGGMIKIQFLICGVPLATDFLLHARSRDKYQWIQAVSATITIGIVVFTWYRWAHFLTYQYWLVEFVHDIRLPASMSEFLGIVFGNLISDIPETWVGYPLLLPLLAGLIFVFRSKPVQIYAITSGLAVFAIYLLLQRQFVFHGYYVLFFSPFLAMAAGKGFQLILESRWAPVIMLLALMAPCWAWMRMHNNWTEKGARIPGSFESPQFRKLATLYSDPHKRYIVGPDPSGCVYFYYLHAKGFPWYKPEDDVASMARWVRKGATGLITDHPVQFEKRYGDSLLVIPRRRAGTFTWCTLQLKKP